MSSPRNNGARNCIKINATDGTLLSFIRRGTADKPNRTLKKTIRIEQKKKWAGRRRSHGRSPNLDSTAEMQPSPKWRRVRFTYTHTDTLTYIHKHTCKHTLIVGGGLEPVDCCKKKPAAVLESDEIFYSTRDELWISADFYRALQYKDSGSKSVSARVMFLSIVMI